MKLTEQFKSFSEEEFAAAFQKEVKTGDFREILTWKTNEGIDVSPFYHGKANAHLNILSHGNDWEINDEIVISDFKKANETALSFLNSGASSLTFIGEIKNEVDLEILLKDIGINYIEINFKNSGENIVAVLAEYCEKNNIDKSELRGCFHLTNVVENPFPQMQTVSVDGAKIHNSGANIHQQLAFVIAEGKEILEKAIESGISPEKSISNIRFSLAVGPNFFFEIAKIRSLRLLWKNVTNQYLPGNTIPVFVHVETSQMWLAKEDVNNNLIRATFQAISAALGGADSIFIHSYSKAEQSERISRNVQLVIKEEGFINKVSDVAAGANYIEEITNELVKLSWKKFQEVEKNGGYSMSIKSEIIQKEIHASASVIKKDLASGKIKMIGVNKHQLPENKNSLSDTLIYDKELKVIDLFS
jgi:methylmalonyl-CoA mutase